MCDPFDAGFPQGIIAAVRANFCLLALLLLSAPAWAQSNTLTPEKRADARLHYENGQRKFDVAKFDEAAEEFVKAYEIVGDPAILYNIAQSYRLGERHEKALFFYKAFLRRMGDRAPNRVEVEKRIAELTRVLNEAKSATTAPPTGTIPPSTGHLESNPKPQPETKPETKPQPETKPETKPEQQPEQQQQQQPPPETKQEEPKPPVNPAPFKYAGIAMAAIAVAALATGGGMSGAAASNSSAVEDGARNHNQFGPNLQSAESNGKLYDTVSYAMYAVGGAAAVTAAVLLYMGYKPRPQTSARLAPAIGAHMAGLSMTGSF
jgi:hypothetical protein